MKSVKQVIVVRKDLKIKRSKLAALVSQVASKFITENNESKRGDELLVKLSKQEAEWINNDGLPIILGVNSQDALDDLILKAEMLNINVNTTVKQSTKPGDESILLCASFGPDEDEIINQVTGNLKPI